MKIIFDYNRTLFDPEQGQLYPGVFDLLSDLSQRHELILVTRPELGREAMLDTLNIRKFFRTVFLPPEKSVELFRTIARKSTLVMVVGDSIHSEIAIGNQLGFITIQVKQGTFAGLLPSHDTHKPTFEIQHIRDLSEIVKTYE